jgi:hypothetical protein
MVEFDFGLFDLFASVDEYVNLSLYSAFICCAEMNDSTTTDYQYAIGSVSIFFVWMNRNTIK